MCPEMCPEMCPGPMPVNVSPNVPQEIYFPRSNVPRSRWGTLGHRVQCTCAPLPTIRVGHTGTLPSGGCSHPEVGTL